MVFGRLWFNTNSFGHAPFGGTFGSGNTLNFPLQQEHHIWRLLPSAVNSDVWIQETLKIDVIRAHDVWIF